MIRKVSVFLETILSRRMERDVNFRKTKVVQSALRFPCELVGGCMRAEFGQDSFSVTTLGKSFEPDADEFESLLRAFSGASRIEATIFLSQPPGFLEIVVRFLERDKPERWDEMVVCVDPDGQRRCQPVSECLKCLIKERKS